MKPKQRKDELDRNFYSCDSLISYALEIENSDITEKVLEILEKFITTFKDIVINNKIIIKEIYDSKVLGNKERLIKYYRIFKALYNLSMKNPELQKTFKTRLNQGVFESLINEFEVFSIKNKRNFISINFKVSDEDSLRIVDCIDKNIRNRIINPEEVIIKNDSIKISFEHPWIRQPTVKTNFIQNGGFTRIDLLRCVYRGYKNIYNDYNLEIDGADIGIGGQLFSETRIKKILYSINKNLVSVRII